MQVQVNQKRQLDRDDALFDIEVAERRLKLSTIASEAQSKAVDVQMKMIEVQKMLMESYTSLCPNQVMDDRVRLMFKDNFINIATHSIPFNSIRTLTEDGDSPSAAPTNKPITISTLAVEMGYRFDNVQLQKIGKKMAMEYRAKYGESPSKHEQLVGQASIYVNSYTEKDRELMQNVIFSFTNK